jgi:excisionase family DNA binding protein
MNTEQTYLTREETAKLLRITTVSLYNYTRQGRIPAYRLNGRLLYKASEIDACLSKVQV